jgi:hypothetical protein
VNHIVLAPFDDHASPAKANERPAGGFNGAPDLNIVEQQRRSIHGR